MPDTELPPVQDQPLLARVTPAVRRMLIRERVRAMEGGVETALRSLADATRLLTGERPRDVVAIGMLRAELLHLDLRHEDALAAMREVVIPRLPELTPGERFGVEQNLSDLQFYAPGAGDVNFYNVVDRKRLLNFDWLDYRDLFSAKQDAERGKHYETLPILWQQHRRAYMHGCWLALRWTSRLLAQECVHLKEWADAVHHVILAGDDTLVGDIAAGILSSRRRELVEGIVRRLLTSANLGAHFVVACKLLGALEDAVPDGLVRAVGDWLLKRATSLRQSLVGPNQLSAAWETIAALAPRFPIDIARSTAAVAVSHPLWTTKLDDPNRVIVERRELVRSLVRLAWVLTPEDIPPLATATLPLLTDRPQSSDYSDVVNLLCHLAKRGGEPVRDALAGALFPPGKPVSRLLAQAAELFGKAEVFDAARVERFADQVTQEIRRQVQWLKPDQTAEPVGEEVMVYTSPKPDRTLKVYIVALSGLYALARHRTKLSEPTLHRLLEAMIDLAQNRDNFCANREGLLQALIEFGDVVPRSARARVLAAVESLARGPVEESTEYPAAAEADNPLNPFKSHMGRPEDVQGMALVALAALAADDASASKRVGDVLEDALCDHRPAIRRAAYAAARKLPDVPDGVILGILSGLRDPDPNAAVSAFAALAEQTGWRVNRNHWRVFLMAGRLAVRTAGPKLRRHAATALVAWAPKCPPHLAGELAELLAELRGDVCRSVRSAADRPEAAAEADDNPQTGQANPAVEGPTTTAGSAAAEDRGTQPQADGERPHGGSPAE